MDNIYKEVFVNKENQEVKVEKIKVFASSPTVVTLRFLESGNTHAINHDDFLQHFKQKSKKEANNINQDIIKLIESGYEFKTFWGTTFDGKEFHIEVEDKL